MRGIVFHEVPVSKTVAILHADRNCAETLANKLRTCFHPVLTTRSVEELRETASRFRVDVGIVDLTTVPVSEIYSLRIELGIEIICTHRVANETMWVQALAAGALDCCYDDDAPAIIRAVGGRVWEAIA